MNYAGPTIPERESRSVSPQMNTALDAIVEFSQSCTYSRLPPPIVAQAKRLLLDGISWMVLGARHETAQRLLEVASPSAERGRSTVVGTNRKADLLDAVFLNAALAQVHDCNDVRRLARRDGGSNHPGRCVIPVALMLGERHRLRGTDLLELLVMGYEVVSRVKVRLPNHEYSSTAAAMAGRVGRLSKEEFRRAIVLAHLGFPGHCAWPDTTDFNFLQNGLIARAALSTIALATAPFTLPTDDCGLLLSTPLPRSDSATPDEYAITNVSIKPYPCCRALHGAVDLALELRIVTQLDPSQIADVEVRVGNTNDLVYQPTGPDAHYKRCQFSIPYVTACAMLDGTVNENSFTPDRIAAQELQAFQQKIRVVRDERLAYNPNEPASLMRPTVVTVTMTDGSLVSRVTLSPKGSRINPLSDEELSAKFFAWTGASFSDEQKEKIVAIVQRIEDVEDVAEFVSLLALEP